MPQTGCNSQCYSLPAKNYCQTVDVEYICGYRRTLTLTDCPCFNNPPDESCTATCDWASVNCQSVSPVLMDLTPAAFMALGASLAAGRIPVHVFA